MYEKEGRDGGSACIENSRRICPQIFRIAILTHIVGLRSVTIVCLSVFPNFSIINDYFLCNEVTKTKKKGHQFFWQVDLGFCKTKVNCNI